MNVTPESAREHWWSRWRARDYSWNGLSNVPTPEGPHQHGVENLQDYWRRHQDDGHVRTDQELINAHVLETLDDGSVWHIVHMPHEYMHDGVLKTTWKADPNHDNWTRLDQLVNARLGVSQDPQRDRFGKIKSVDTRAILDGMVARKFPTSGTPHAHNCGFLGDVGIPSGGIKPGSTFESCLFERVEFVKGAVNAVDFSKSVILGELQAIRIQFNSLLDLSGCQIFGGTEIIDCQISGPAKFRGTWFFDDANFVATEFRGPADFSKSRFEGFALFESTTTPADLTFDQIRLKEIDDCSRYASSVAGTLTIGVCMFFVFGLLSSEWSFFVLSLGFFIALGIWSVWGGVVSHSGLSGRRADDWWKFGAWEYSDSRFERHTRAMRRLIQISDSVRNSREASRFHQLELRAIRLRPSTGIMERTFSGLYDALALYGQSLLRPVFGLIVVILLAAGIYWSLEGGRVWRVWEPTGTARLEIDADFIEALNYSLNRVSPFRGNRTGSDRSCDSFARRLEAIDDCRPSRGAGMTSSQLAIHRVLTTAVVGFQSVLVLTLLFLLALAIRRKFQIT